MPGGISSFSGEVVHTDRLAEVSGLAVSGTGSTWTDVHREIWVRPWRGVERKFTFTNANVPVRKGHRVTLLVGGGRPLALINFSTEQYVNLVTPRQFELFGATEAFTFAALLVAAGLTAPSGLAGLAIGAGVYGLIKWLARQDRYRKVSTSVDAEIRRTIERPPVAKVSEQSQQTAP